MSELKTNTAKARAKILCFISELDLDVFLGEDVATQFEKDLDDLIRTVQNETELAMLRGETRHLGEKHMLLTCVYSALSMSLRPVQREASFTEFKQALDIYLDIKLPKRTGKRLRRKLLRRL
jgi:hypothetical protein